MEINREGILLASAVCGSMYLKKLKREKKEVIKESYRKVDLYEKS